MNVAGFLRPVNDMAVQSSIFSTRVRLFLVRLIVYSRLRSGISIELCSGTHSKSDVRSFGNDLPVLFSTVGLSYQVSSCFIGVRLRMSQHTSRVRPPGLSIRALVTPLQCVLIVYRGMY